MSITILFVIVSILWLWFGVRFNFVREGLSFVDVLINSGEIKEVIQHRKVERKAKWISTIVVLLTEYVNYFFNHDSLALFFALVIGWLLFYLIQLEMSLIFSRVKRFLEQDKENRQYILDKIREIEK